MLDIVLSTNKSSLSATRREVSTVFHYTSSAGLAGILESGIFQATDLRYLNDSSELIFGLIEALSFYETRSQASTAGSLLNRLADLYRVEPWSEQPSLRPSHAGEVDRMACQIIAQAIVRSLPASTAIGVICFCVDGDLLGQWRGYGSGGYSLGLDSKVIADERADASIPLARVIYGRPPVSTELRAISESVAQIASGGWGPNDRKRRILDDVTLPLLCFAAKMKDPAFESEQEYRIGDLSGPTADIGIRSSRRGITPYVNIDLRVASSKLLPIREVVVSPGPEMVLRVAAVRTLLAARGYPVSGDKEIEVRPSAIPFRD